MLKQESSAFSEANSWQVPGGAEHPVQADQWTKYIPCLFVGAYLAIHLTINAPILALGVCLSSAVWMVGRNTFLKDRTLQPLVAPVLTILFAFAVWTGAATPAHALFFGAAETFFQSTFPTASAVTPMAFGALRAIFLLYIAISLIRVNKGGRQDEDWQTLARAPLMAPMSVAVADILTTLVRHHPQSRRIDEWGRQKGGRPSEILSALSQPLWFFFSCSQIEQRTTYASKTTVEITGPLIHEESSIEIAALFYSEFTGITRAFLPFINSISVDTACGDGILKHMPDRGWNFTPVTLKAFQVSLVKPVAYLKYSVKKAAYL